MRKMLALLLLTAGTAAVAHDFWLQPLRFAFATPGPVPMRIYVGHGSARDRWGLGADRVVLFSSIGPDGLVNRKSSLQLGAPEIDAIVPLTQPGTYVFAFQSTASTSDLPYLRFNDYVAVEGITPIAAYRARIGAERKNGRELYSRRAKTIVEIGPVEPAGIARATRPVGLSLEIVPERHPAMLKAGERLPLRILYRRKPLAGAFVKLTNLDADDKPIATARTDAAGRVSFVIPKGGQWQFNVIWSNVVKDNPAADYVTTFSSLTFGT